jgi:hypothetical protein
VSFCGQIGKRMNRHVYYPAMPHWTLPRPAPDDPVADAVKAIASLQTQLDTLFAGDMSPAALDDVSGHVRTFSKEFEEHATEARSRLSKS